MKTRCWEWTGAILPQGYGKFQLPYNKGEKQKAVKAHRFGFELQNGSITRLPVLHRCDNKACVRKSHLKQGTSSDNQQDFVKRGTHWKHRENGVGVKSKITMAIAREIRKKYESGIPGYKIAEQYDLSVPHTYDIIRQKYWREK